MENLEVEIFVVNDAQYRVVDQRREHIFTILRAAPEEPIELMAEFPYTYNRETVRGRAIRVAEMLRDGEVL